MTFKHKLSRRLALLFSATAVVALAMNACEIPLVTTPPADVAQLIISPKTATVQPDQDVMFTSVAFTAQGDTAQISVSWSTTGGSVTDTSTNGKRHYGHWRNSSCVTVMCPTPVSAALSTVATAPASITAGSGSATITVTVKDANGNPISGATVVLSATGSGNTLTQPSGTTDASGVATGTLSSTVAGSKTVSATASGTAITQTASVTVNPGSVSASQSTLTASPTSIAVGSATTITVTAKDANGNRI